MTLKDIEYFYTVAKEKNITKAAAALFIAQPALSQCIKKLENEMGIMLFIRNKAGTTLTKEGECFYAFAQKVLNEKKQLDAQLQDMKNGEGGTVKLGFSGSQASFILPQILPAFRTDHPNIEIQLVESLSVETEKKLIAREIDIAIIPKPILFESIEYFEFSRDDMVLLPSRSSEYKRYAYTDEKDGKDYISMDFFRTEPIVTTFPGQKTRMITDIILSRAGITPNIKQMARNIITVKALAQMDTASALVPRKLLGTISDRPCFAIPSRYSEPYSYVVAYLKDAYISQAMRNLMNAFLLNKFSF